MRRSHNAEMERCEIPKSFVSHLNAMVANELDQVKAKKETRKKMREENYVKFVCAPKNMRN